MRRWWPPLAAISRARRARCWPRTSFMSPTGSGETSFLAVTCASSGVFPAQVPVHVEEAACGKDAHLAHQARRDLVARGQNQGAARLARLQCTGQRAAARAQRSGERELADHFVRVEAACVDLARCREDSHRDRQVELTAMLGQLRGGEVDGDALSRKREVERHERAADAVLGLLYRGLREPDDGEGGQPAAQVHLHRHQRGFDAGSSPTEHHGKRHRSPRASPFPSEREHRHRGPAR